METRGRTAFTGIKDIDWLAFEFTYSDLTHDAAVSLPIPTDVFTLPAFFCLVLCDASFDRSSSLSGLFAPRLIYLEYPEILSRRRRMSDVWSELLGRRVPLGLVLEGGRHRDKHWHLSA